MDIKAIVFDKDGTLVEYEAFWCSIATEAVKKVLCKIGVDIAHTDKILRLAGFDGKVAAVDGIMRCGTYGDFADLFYDYLVIRGLASVDRAALHGFVREAYYSSFHIGRLIPACDDLRGFLAGVRARGIVTALVTNDSIEGSEHFLRHFGIEDMFDSVYSDDGRFAPKPEPDILYDFAKRHSVLPENILVAGDTLSDIRFAHNAGAYAVAVAPDEHNRKILSQYAPVVGNIKDITGI